MKKSLLLLGLAVFSILPRIASADCADLSRYTNWFLESAHEVVFYMGNVPLASVNISDCTICTIVPSSTILLIKSFVCDSDRIIADGRECAIMTVKVMY